MQDCTCCWHPAGPRKKACVSRCFQTPQKIPHTFQTALPVVAATSKLRRSRRTHTTHTSTPGTHHKQDRVAVDSADTLSTPLLADTRARNVSAPVQAIWQGRPQAAIGHYNLSTGALSAHDHHGHDACANPERPRVVRRRNAPGECQVATDGCVTKPAGTNNPSARRMGHIKM